MRSERVAARIEGFDYEGGIRVPMIARWPGVMPAGHASAEMTSLMGLVPTFVDLAGGRPAANIDRMDILDLPASEKYNLAAAHPDPVEQMRSRMPALEATLKAGIAARSGYVERVPAKD
jgi:arylsulfatase A-like enzyme